MAANTARLQGRVQLRHHHRGVPPLLRGEARRDLHPGTYANVTGNQALAWGLIAAGQAGQAPRSSTPRTRSPRRPTSSTNSPGTGTSGCAPSRPRTRSPPPAPPSAPRSPATSAVTGTCGPGLALKSETISLAADDRAAAGDRRRAAGRAIDRPAHQDRAVRPADGDVRPPRRGAAAGGRGRHHRRMPSRPPSRRPGSPSST